MISTDRLAAFLVTAYIIIVIPGPSVLFAVGRALGSGRRVALVSILGNACGNYLQVVAVAFGIGALVERSILAFTFVKVAGGLYLLYLGVRTFRHRGDLRDMLTVPPPERSDRRSFVEGLVVGATNPKTIVFLPAVLPQFVSRDAGHVSAQILLLGLMFAAIAVLSDSVWVMAAGSFRQWFARSPKRLEAVGGIGGVAIGVVGAGVLLTGRKD